MRKLIVAFGLILICIGTALMYNYNTKELRAAKTVVAAQDNSWSVESALDKGDTVEIKITPPTDWATGYFDILYIEGEERPVLHTPVTISPLQGNSTLFEVDYTVFANVSTLVVWNISLFQVINPSNRTAVSVPDLKTDCLNTTVWYNSAMNGFYAVGGTVEFTHVYTISVDKARMNPSRTTPPSRIEIVKRTLQITYPNSFFLPTGAVIAVAGAIVTFLGLRAEPKKFRSKRNRRVLQKKANR